MNHRATPRFWACYRALPEDVQRLADRHYEFLKNDPRHPSLHLKKVGKLWSVRVGLHYRALAVEDSGDLLWVWIGTRADYDRLVQQQAG
jgi:hypothetical protein